MTALSDPLAPLLVTRHQPRPGAQAWSAPRSGRGGGTPMLSEWLTVDSLPEVECETCGGTGVCECDYCQTKRRDNERCGTGGESGCGGSGRRLLAADDRVRLVQGEWPAEFPATFGRYEITMTATGPWAWSIVRHPDRPNFPLPAPGTVVGEAVVDWVGPIVDSGSALAHWKHHDPGDSWVVVGPSGLDRQEGRDGAGRVRLLRLDMKGFLHVTEITGHGHVDWSPGRFAIRLREARAL